MGDFEYNKDKSKGFVRRHVKAVLRLGRVITKADQIFGRISRPRQGETAGPRRGLKFPAATDVRKDVAADSQQKTANLNISAG